jgi:putative sterol carrier protein
MAIDFPSQEWLEALMKELNSSKAYQEAAKNWEGDFYFIFEPGDEIESHPGYAYWATESSWKYDEDCEISEVGYRTGQLLHACSNKISRIEKEISRDVVLY